MADPGGDNAGGQKAPAPPLIPPPEAVGNVLPPPESDESINEGANAIPPLPSASASASPPKSDMAVGNAMPSPPPPPPKSDMAVSDVTHPQTPLPPPSPPPQKSDKTVSDTTPPPPPQKSEVAVGDTVPAPPPPKSKMAVDDAIIPPPSPKSHTAAGEKTPAPPPETKMAGQPPPRQPSVQAEQAPSEPVPGMSQPNEPTRTSSPERAVAAGGAEKQLPALPSAPPPHQGNTTKNDKDSSATGKPSRAEEKPTTSPASRWGRLRSPVLLLLSLFRQRRLIDQPPKKISPVAPEDDGTGNVPDKPAVHKDEAEGSKRRRHEADQASSGPMMKPPETKRRKSLSRTESSLPPAGEADTDSVVPGSAMKTKLQNACWLVKNTMSWYGRHRSPANAEKPAEDQGAAQKDKAQGTKPSPSPGEEKEAVETNSKKQDEIEEEITKQPSTTQQVQEEKEAAAENKKPHPKWEQEETRLEEILEAACIRLVKAEYSRRLSDDKKKQQQCLLSFSVFPLGSKVKKQAVTYWWSTQFDLPLEKSPSASANASAYKIFEDLSEEGFLEPIKNHCSKVIHGCRVNPLVHWMVKHLAKDKNLADLDDHGNPADYLGKSQVHCFTAGNRGQLQKLREEDDSRVQPKPSQTKEPPKGAKAAGGPSQIQRKPSETKELHQDAEAFEGSSKAHLKPGQTKEVPDGGQSQGSAKKTKHDAEAAVLLKEFEKKQVILNINANVYRLPEPLLQSKLADQLQVLQLGQWWNTDDNTYMEVEALESLSAIGKLKNLRYLGLRGLSKLTRLPSEVRRLRRLAILDARGCQNLVEVPSATVKTLNSLTLLDLSECYMLEHIGRGVTSLTELRVFKGFVFGVGKRRSDACRLQHLTKLKKLRKLTLNVTTDADVQKDEMAQLEKLASVRSLTVTWGEWPIFLLDADVSKEQRLKQLLDKWTGLVLPPGLEKLDVRCYPTSGELPVTKWLRDPMKLKKLYVRGGGVEGLDIPDRNSIETLRLRFLNKFSMKWNDLLPGLKRNNIKSVEVVDKDQKVTKNLTKGNLVQDDEQKEKKEAVVQDDEQNKKKKEECVVPLRKRMEIPRCTIDENGVWVRDLKEEELEKNASKSDAAASTAGQTGQGKAQTDVKEGRPHEIVKEDQKDNNNKKKEKDEEQNGPEVQELKEDEKKRASTSAVVDQAVAPGSAADVRKSSAVTCCSMFHTSLKRLKLSGGQALRKAPREDASTKAEPATGAAAAGIPKIPDNKTGEGDNDAGKVQKEAKEGMDNKKKANEEEHGALVRDEKDQNKEASTTAAVSPAVPPTSDGDAKKAAVLNKVYTDKRSEPSKASEVPSMAPKEDARKAQSSSDHGNTEQEDETDTDEDRGDGLDADEPQTEGDGKDQGQVGGSKVFDTVDKQPTAAEDGGGDDDGRAGDATSPPAVQPPELEEKTPAKLTPATPPVPPAATTSAAPAPAAAGQAAAEPKEPGPTGTGGADTSGSTTS